jgi:hypothetical protein
LRAIELSDPTNPRLGTDFGMQWTPAPAARYRGWSLHLGNCDWIEKSACPAPRGLAAPKVPCYIQHPNPRRVVLPGGMSFIQKTFALIPQKIITAPGR